MAKPLKVDITVIGVGVGVLSFAVSEAWFPSKALISAEAAAHAPGHPDLFGAHENDLLDRTSRPLQVVQRPT